MIRHAAIRLRYEALEPVLDELGRRRYAAAEAMAAGHGGVSAVSRITGIARSTIKRGLDQLRGGVSVEAGRVRQPGGGRKRLTDKDPTLIADLQRLVEPATRGDPRGPLRWTAKSLRNIAAGLRELGHCVSHSVVADLLRDLGYSLQANRKTREGTSHPDRDAQFSTLAEVERVVRSYFLDRDSLEPVSRTDLLDRVKKGLVTVLDVRPEDEFALGHLAGAISMPLDRLKRQLAKLSPKKEIVAYCRGPYCVLSFEAVALLRAKGFTARRLQDGYPEWRAAGLPVEGAGPYIRVMSVRWETRPE